MNKKTIFTLLYVFLIVGLLLFMIWMVTWLKSDSGECMINPKGYYEEKTGLICDCRVNNGINYDFDDFNLTVMTQGG